VVSAACDIIRWSIERGSDDASRGGGGIIYFIDAEGYSPPQLEWPMKLWWPHNEAMIATAMAYRATGEAVYMHLFDKVATWAYSHLVDRERGEWFGYADRDGNVTHRFKGGAYKGCFHVPRSLLMCSTLLAEE
jgi:N-acylglucosamine 2-epimerase